MSVPRAKAVSRWIRIAVGSLAILSLLTACLVPAAAAPGNGNGRGNGPPDRTQPPEEEPEPEPPVEEEPDPDGEPPVDEEPDPPVETLGLPTVVQHQAFGDTYSGEVRSGAWAPLAEERLLALVALRPAGAEVAEVKGNGLRWTRVRRHRDVQGELAVEVWQASGPDPAEGAIEVTTSSDAWAMNVQALRLTPSSVVAHAGSDTGVEDTRYPSVEVVSPGARTLLLGVHVGRATPFTADEGLDTASEHAVGEGGNHVRATVLSRDSTEAGAHALGGIQSSPLDWVMAGLVVTSSPMGGGEPPVDEEPEPPAEEEPEPPVEEEPEPPVDEEPEPPVDAEPEPPAGDGIVPVYSTASPWNTPIEADAPIHPDSTAFVSRFEASAAAGVKRPLTSDPTQYTYGIYRTSVDAPHKTIQLSGNYSDVRDETTTRRSSAPILRLPIPTEAQPSPGTDASVVIWDPETGDEWGFWEFENHGDGTYSARNGYHYNTRWSGVPPTSPDQFGSRGAGVPYFAGLVRRDEVDAGRIDHALAFAYDYPSNEVVWPATKSDGLGEIGQDVPEGARIRIGPSVTEADFDAWGLSREGKIIARALQRYGMYTIDNAGRPKIMIEDEATAAWGGTITASTISGIPWEVFEVIDWRAPKPPVAVLGADATHGPNAFVTLDGSASYAIDGSPISRFAWEAPEGIELDGASTATPTWDTSGVAAGRYEFSLQVQDGAGAWSLAPATITYTLESSAIPTALQQQTFGGTYTNMAQSGSWAPLADEELLAVVSLRPARTEVEAVTGNGLVWTRVLRHRDTQGELAVEVWRASGPAPAAGPVAVSTSADAWAMNVQTLRLTPSRVVYHAAADTGPTDTNQPLVDVAAPDGTALLLGVHVGRSTTFTLDDGLDGVSVHAVGDGGNLVRATLLSRPTTAAGIHTLGGTQSSALDWVMAGLALQPR